jgi:hypothetical protein
MAQLVLQLRHVLHDAQAAALAASALALLVVCPLLALLVFGIDGGRRTPSTAAAAARAAREKLLLSKLPSPPSKLPVIGHLHLVGSLPHVSLRDLAAKHGRDGLMLLRLGAVPTLVVSSPSAARTVLRTHDHVFASRGYSSIADVLFYGSTDVGFSPYGEHWRKVKKIATTHLLSNRKVRSYRHAREEEVRLVISKIREAAATAASRRTTAVDLSELLNSFTNDIVCRAVSGKFFRGEGRNKLFRELVKATALLIGGFNVEDYFPALVKMGVVKRMVCAKARKVWNRMDGLLDKIIDDHASSSKPDGGGGGEESDDFIDVLLSVQQEYNLTRDHIKAQLSVSMPHVIDFEFPYCLY